MFRNREGSDYLIQFKNQEELSMEGRAAASKDSSHSGGSMSEDIDLFYQDPDALEEDSIAEKEARVQRFMEADGQLG